MGALLKRSLSFAHHRDGSAAIEFALVMPLVLAIVLSSFEAGWMMAQKTMLNRALDTTIRLMRVGAAGAPTNQDQMKQAVCKSTLIIRNCLNVITIEMTQVTSASDFPTSAATCVDRSKSVQPTVSFTPGSRSSIMYVRACVVADPLVPGLGLGLALTKDSTGAYSFVASGAFMNEPGA